jgi:hypothetical protein
VQKAMEKLKTTIIKFIALAMQNFDQICQINLADGTTYKTPIAIATKQISDLPILDIKSGVHD